MHLRKSFISLYVDLFKVHLETTVLSCDNKAYKCPRTGTGQFSEIFFYEKKFYIMKALIFLVFEHIFIESSIIKSTHAYAHVHTHHLMKFSVCGVFVDD